MIFIRHALTISTLLLILLAESSAQIHNNLEIPLSINTDGTAPDPTSILDLASKNKGLLIPRMSTNQRNNIVNPATGLLVYVTSDNLYYYYDGSAWISFSAQPTQPSTPLPTWGVQPSTQNQKILANDNMEGDMFGISVDISGDYAIVGANRDDNDTGTNTGSAYIYRLEGNIWVQEAKLTANDGSPYDEFGNSVSISGSYAIVGAPNDDDKGSNSGSAYIFQRSGTSWSQVAKLSASDGSQLDNFGFATSISGNYAVVGASGDDDGGINTGSAYVFLRNGAVWGLQSKLTANDGAPSDNFGTAVDISGNYIVVGANRNDGDGIEIGSAYVYRRQNTSWSQQAKLVPSDGDNYDSFGVSVSISGTSIVIGSWADDDNDISSGSAYVYTRSGTSWTQQTKLIPNDGNRFNYFGRSVSIDNDYIVIGSYGNNYNGFESGSAYIFEGAGRNWNQIAKLTANDGEAYDDLGFAVSISGVYTIVGTPYSDDAGFSSGSAYFYRRE